ncbi:MAG: AAA family ATPase, partial [Lachnospiraceae bacterium]|nr:AAA family ATPase [Lachnospiraceae bacterium]
TTKEQDYDKMKSGVMEEVKRLFKPEFINRIDEIMVFHPLHREDMKKIVTLLAQNLVKRCKEQMEIELVITPSVKEWLIEKHMDAKMGARPMKRAIQSEIEDALAEEILRGSVKQGDRVSAGLKNKKIVFTVRDDK